MPGKIARGDSSFWPISSLLKSRETTDWLSFRCLPSFLFSATTATFTLERFYSHKVRKYLSSLQLRKSRRGGSLPRLQSEGRGKIESSTQGKESHQHDCQEQITFLPLRDDRDEEQQIINYYYSGTNFWKAFLDRLNSSLAPTRGFSLQTLKEQQYYQL